MLTNVPRGTASIRDAAREMLKYLDRYGRKMKQAVPETRLDRCEAAVAKVCDNKNSSALNTKPRHDV